MGEPNNQPKTSAPAPGKFLIRPGSLALVFIGGMVGTAARQGLSLWLPPLGAIPWTILLINLVGALCLGLLLEFLLRRGPDVGRRRHLRLLLGTGFLGGFTTYSTLATDTALLLTGGAAPTALAYAFTTVLFGAASTWLGLATGARLARRPAPSRRSKPLA